MTDEMKLRKRASSNRQFEHAVLHVVLCLVTLFNSVLLLLLVLLVLLQYFPSFIL